MTAAPMTAAPLAAALMAANPVAFSLFVYKNSKRFHHNGKLMAYNRYFHFSTFCNGNFND
jgi:hypothetical protein